MLAKNGDLLTAMHILRGKLLVWKILVFTLLFVVCMVFATRDSAIDIKHFYPNEQGGELETITYKQLHKLKKPGVVMIKISGVITENLNRSDIMRNLRDEKNCSALLVYLDSPGGTVVGSEILFKDLRYIADKVPVVAVIGSTAASGGYMAAIAADRIFAHEGTITGSIGVIMQTAEITDMLQNIGIQPITVKSDPLKASPSPLEKFTDSGRQMIQEVIDDSYDFFAALVKDRRRFTEDEIKSIADGRIYTGRQALRVGLIDELGGKNEAIHWLQEEGHIHEDTPVYNMVFEKKRNSLFGNLSLGRVYQEFHDTYMNNGLLAMLSMPDK